MGGEASCCSDPLEALVSHFLPILLSDSPIHKNGKEIRRASQVLDRNGVD
jgi:hypothetical protein